MVRFGPLQLYIRFDLIDCHLRTILGMPFLSKVNPKIDWKTHTVKVPYKSRHFIIPTISTPASVTPPVQPPSPTFSTPNEFVDLDPEPLEPIITHTIDTPDHALPETPHSCPACSVPAIETQKPTKVLGEGSAGAVGQVLDFGNPPWPPAPLPKPSGDT